MLILSLLPLPAMPKRRVAAADAGAADADPGADACVGADDAVKLI